MLAHRSIRALPNLCVDVDGGPAFDDFAFEPHVPAFRQRTETNRGSARRCLVFQIYPLFCFHHEDHCHMFRGLHFVLDRGIRHARPRCFLQCTGMCKQGLHRNRLPSIRFWNHGISIHLHLPLSSACGRLVPLIHTSTCDDSARIIFRFFLKVGVEILVDGRPPTYLFIESACAQLARHGKGALCAFPTCCHPD